MMIAGEDFTEVIDLAAREHGWDSLASQAQAYDSARDWLARNVGLVETWIERPRYADVDSLLFRKLMSVLRGDDVTPSCDATKLVIAAGEGWSEEPSHSHGGGFLKTEAKDSRGYDNHEWNVANGISDDFETKPWR